MNQTLLCLSREIPVYFVHQTGNHEISAAHQEIKSRASEAIPCQIEETKAESEKQQMIIFSEEAHKNHLLHLPASEISPKSLDDVDGTDNYVKNPVLGIPAGKIKEIEREQQGKQIVIFSEEFHKLIVDPAKKDMQENLPAVSQKLICLSRELPGSLRHEKRHQEVSGAHRDFKHRRFNAASRPVEEIQAETEKQELKRFGDEGHEPILLPNENYIQEKKPQTLAAQKKDRDWSKFREHLTTKRFLFQEKL